MTDTHIQQLDSFSEDNLPDLDEVVLGALELFADTQLPEIDFSQFKRPLVVGSGNAAVAGRVLFDSVDAIFADESSYLKKLETMQDIDGAVLISASGGKHAVGIAQELQNRHIETLLLTNNADAPAKQFVSEENVCVFPKNREPYTYNTSTYMGMFLSKTNENPSDILQHLETVTLPTDFSEYDAYYLIVPESFEAVGEMFKTKFNELFGPKVMGRIYTLEQTKHAKTVVPSDKELFISFGEENTLFGEVENRLHVSLPDNADYVAMMAIGYYVIGTIQKQIPPYFKENIAHYAQEASKLFGSTIPVIVE